MSEDTLDKSMKSHQSMYVCMYCIATKCYMNRCTLYVLCVTLIISKYVAM